MTDEGGREDEDLDGYEGEGGRVGDVFVFRLFGFWGGVWDLSLVLLCRPWDRRMKRLSVFCIVSLAATSAGGLPEAASCAVHFYLFFQIFSRKSKKQFKKNQNSIKILINKKN